MATLPTGWRWLRTGEQILTGDVVCRPDDTTGEHDEDGVVFNSLEHYPIRRLVEGCPDSAGSGFILAQLIGVTHRIGKAEERNSASFLEIADRLSKLEGITRSHAGQIAQLEPNATAWKPGDAGPAPVTSIRNSEALRLIALALEMPDTTPEALVQAVAQLRLDKAAADVSTKHLFHRLWTRAVGTPGYDKREWLELAKTLDPESYCRIVDETDSIPPFGM